ncbi:hypothetical protein PI125_g20168 [Phytophthora idaei]|nr:hypothetical protein PI125_g20168 [Phytophthora idaei]
MVVPLRRPVLKCINKRMLKSFSAFQLRIPVDNMMEVRLLAASNLIIGSVINDVIPDVIGVMARHQKVGLSQKDVKDRILDYFDCMEEVIEIHGSGKCLKDNIKLKCKIIVENLIPDTLKEQIKPAIDCDPTRKSNLHRRLDVVNQGAIKNQQAFDFSQLMEKRENGGRESDNKKRQQAVPKPHSRYGDRKSTPSPTRKKREWLPPGWCLYCKRGDHLLHDCPAATESRKKDAKKAYIESKKRDKELSSVNRLTTNQSAGKKEVTFNDLVTMRYSLNNGTVHNVITRSMVHELEQLDFPRYSRRWTHL